MGSLVVYKLQVKMHQMEPRKFATGALEQDEVGEDDTVRVLVLGDEKVGKTSVISTLVSQHFNEKVPAIIHDVQIPAEESQEHVVTTITDSSSRSEDFPTVLEQIKNADVVIVLYDVTRPETFARISSYWLPLVEKTNQVPVTLVGNKIDLRPSGENQLTDGSEELRDMMKPLMKEFKIVEACLECSAKAVLNIQQVFYFAQKAVLYPIAPVFDMEKSELQANFIKVLTRLFRIFDTDRDGILSEKELNCFQLASFGVHLQPDEIAGIFKVLSIEFPLGIEQGKGIKLAGFLYLHKLFVEKNRTETLWMVARAFGYTDRMELRLPDSITEPPPHELDQSTVLSTHAARFMTETFHQYAKDGIIRHEELVEIFSIFPTPGSPWSERDMPRPTESGKKGSLSLEGWIALWTRAAVLDAPNTIRNLIYLGFPEVVPPAIDVTRRRKPFRTKSHVPLKTIRCFVLGSRECGKSMLLNALLRDPFSPVYYPTKTTRSIANMVAGTATNHDKSCLILTEFSPEDGETLLSGDTETVFSACDVVCYVYDPRDTSSLEYIILLQKYIPDNIPCMFVGTKADLLEQDFADSEQWHTVLRHCASLELDQPMLTSTKTGQHVVVDEPSASLYSKLVDLAQYPQAARPMTDVKRKALRRKRGIKTAIVTAVLTASVATVLAMVFRRSQHKR